jgi:hypothetical protein
VVVAEVESQTLIVEEEAGLLVPLQTGRRPVKKPLADRDENSTGRTRPAG